MVGTRGWDGVRIARWKLKVVKAQKASIYQVTTRRQNTESKKVMNFC